MRFAVYPATIVGFDASERTVTVKIGEPCSMTEMGIAIGDPAELRPNPADAVRASDTVLATMAAANEIAAGSVASGLSALLARDLADGWKAGGSGKEGGR